jgi:sortase A
MIPVTKRQRLKIRAHPFAFWTGSILFLVGALTISYVALTLLYAKHYQEAAGKTLEKQIYAKEQHKAGLSQDVAKEGDVLGRIEVPRLKLRVAILEGTTAHTLRLGVGHIDGTAFPGTAGSIGIAGHRDTYFRGLKDIRRNDDILIQTAAGISTYEVDWIRITDPGDGGILAPTADSGLTLVTCYPFHYIGAAPERYVIHAHRQ